MFYNGLYKKFAVDKTQREYNAVSMFYVFNFLKWYIVQPWTAYARSSVTCIGCKAGANQ